MTHAFDHEPPRVFSEFKPWLKSCYDDLPKRLQAVANFSMEHPDVIAMSTIATISERAEVTPSTLVRFAKSLGYRGFTDMQAVFRESMHHIAQPYSQRLHRLERARTSERTVLRRFGQAARDSLDRLEQNVDEGAIIRASQLLARARTIFVAGQGRATPVATYLHYTFIKMGLQAALIDGIASAMSDKAELIRGDQALVAISFSPYTANTREIVDICLKRKVPVVAMTDSTLSPIARPDDIHLEVLEEEVGGIRGLSATMCLAISLAVETGKTKSQNSH